MVTMNFSFSRSLMLALLLSACSQTLDLDIQLVTESCDGDENLNPLKDGANEVTQFEFVITGDGIDSPIQTLMNRSDGTLTLPEIPIGPNVNIHVNARLASGIILSMGQTGPMNLVDVTEKIPAAIFLRRTNAFTSTNQVDAPKGPCSQLSRARAGHTASVLSDGRVLIAGGFVDDDAGLRTYLKSTEIYDPRSGKVTAGPDLMMERAFHTSTHVPGTTLTVIAGGERPDPNTSDRQALEALRTAEIYNEATGQFARAFLQKARTRHAAAVPSNGLLALIGGFDGSTPIASVETFDPRKLEAGESPFTEETIAELGPRTDHAAIAVGSNLILVAGGYDGAQLLSSTTLLRVRDTGNYEAVSGWGVELSTARAAPLMAAIDDTSVVVTGGFASRPPDRQRFDVTNSPASDVTDVIRFNDAESGELIAFPDLELGEKRARGGIASIGKQRVLIGGGASKTSSNEISTSKSAELLFVEGEDIISKEKQSVPGTLSQPRYQSTWTVLQDGTVLVAGGVEHTGPGQASFLKSLEVFQPAP